MAATSRHERRRGYPVGSKTFGMLVALALAVGMAVTLLGILSIQESAFGATASEERQGEPEFVLRENLLRSLTVTSTTINPQTKDVSVKGHVTFAPAVKRAWGEVYMEQDVGRVATVYGWSELGLKREDGNKVAFTTTFPAFEGRFSGGKATMWLYAYTYFEREGVVYWDEDFLDEVEVQLRTSR